MSPGGSGPQSKNAHAERLSSCRVRHKGAGRRTEIAFRPSERIHAGRNYSFEIGRNKASRHDAAVQSARFTGAVCSFYARLCSVIHDAISAPEISYDCPGWIALGTMKCDLNSWCNRKALCPASLFFK